MNYELLDRGHKFEEAAVLDHALHVAREASKTGHIILVNDKQAKRIRARAWCGKVSWVKPCACTMMYFKLEGVDCKCGGTGLIEEGPCS